MSMTKMPPRPCGDPTSNRRRHGGGAWRPVHSRAILEYRDTQSLSNAGGRGERKEERHIVRPIHRGSVAAHSRRILRHWGTGRPTNHAGSAAAHMVSEGRTSPDIAASRHRSIVVPQHRRSGILRDCGPALAWGEPARRVPGQRQPHASGRRAVDVGCERCRYWVRGPICHLPGRQHPYAPSSAAW